ncbi:MULTISPECIES: DNA cytosine methyltransferase [Bacillus amyloliquefaciens group]|uniref:DNA cytosine methyltransferase n=1 Tax=Bacillus amyloliquefaciens group TaxID=1938374 RepID=UPI0013F59BDD|nr:DNA cytosine methyltransferase [Bacillus velezensis]MEC2215926.1 DNA cytosine methyltransferase [Bacillus velezensis]
MNRKPKIFSFFSGAGFLDLGFERSGYDIVFTNEVHQPFMEAYKFSRAKLGMEPPQYGYYEGDITTLTQTEGKIYLSELVDQSKKEGLVGFIGGPPCPDFSVGGKNKGGTGENGKLTATYIELICQQTPDFFVFENVKGLWRTKKHRIFYEEMKTILHSSGYITTEKLINALEYGAPQHRERIIMIGFKKELLGNLGYKDIMEDKLIKENVFPWEKNTKYSINELNNIIWPEIDTYNEDSTTQPPNNIIEELTVEHWFRKNQVYQHPNNQKYFQPKAGLIKFQSIAEGDVTKKSYKRLHRWRYSPTASYGNNEVHIHPYKSRRISVSEALAIQSLPKEFVLPQDMTLTNSFKTIGNGVPYVASYGIANTILDFLNFLDVL